jgi:transcription initiation factor TFIIF subunit alpha
LTKKSLREGLRFHIMRLAPPHQKTGQPDIDPSNQDDFTRPVTLHRRDPRQPPPGREFKEEMPESTPEASEEADRLAQLKAEREAQRAMDDAQKAPVIKENAKNVDKQKEKKRGTEVNKEPKTERQKKESAIRYSEALPWHLEDADGKNVWVGQYEAPLSDAKVALIIDGERYRMVPMEKWYKFSSKRAVVNAMSIEEVEQEMGKKAPMARWAVRNAERNARENLMAESRVIMNGPAGVKQESSTFKTASRKEKMEHDDIDMNLTEEFQDDDELPGFEPDRDEESKDAQDRIRREQMNANLFGEADEKAIDKEEEATWKEELERKLLGKDMKKALKKRDKQFQYDSDDSERERDPFAESVSDVATT